MAYCAKCGSQLREGAKFCPKCGAEAPAAKTRGSSRTGLRAVGPMLAVLVLLLVVWGLVLLFGGDKDDLPGVVPVAAGATDTQSVPDGQTTPDGQATPASLILPGGQTVSNAPPEPQLCPRCDGAGSIMCLYCDGTGVREEYVSIPNYTGGSIGAWQTVNCPNPQCINGLIMCTTCGGDGWIYD